MKPESSLPLQHAAASIPDGRVFHTLDALRGIAAIGVVMFHIGAAFAPLATPGGYLAVDLFFMMSGVVLSHAYEHRFRAGMGVFDFMRLRFIRLYPLYLMGTLFGLAVTLASMHGGNLQHWDAVTLLQAVLFALLFLPNFPGRPVIQMFPLNIPCWSLFLEILVNLLFVLTWPLLAPRRLVVVSLLSGGAVLAAIIQGGSIDQGWVLPGFAAGLARTVFGFSVGVLIARHVPHARRVVSNGRFLAIAAVVVIAIGGWPAGQWRAIWDAVCVLVVFPAMVYWGTLIDPGPRLQRIATFLGVTSYAIYVLHGPLASVLNSVSRHFGGGEGLRAGSPFTGIVVLTFLLAACWLVDRHYDAPLRRWLGRVLPRARSRPAGS